MTWLVALSLLTLGCGGSSSSTGSGTSSATDATSGAPGSTGTDTSGDDTDTGVGQSAHHLGLPRVPNADHAIDRHKAVQQ